MTWLEEIKKQMEEEKFARKTKKPAWMSQINTEINNIPVTAVKKDASNFLYLAIFVLSVVTLMVYMDKHNLKPTDLFALYKQAPEVVVAPVLTPPKADLNEQVDAIKAKLEELESYTNSNLATTTEQVRLLAIVNNNNTQALRYGCFHEVVFIDSNWKLSKIPTRVALSEADMLLVKKHLK